TGNYPYRNHHNGEHEHPWPAAEACRRFRKPGVPRRVAHFGLSEIHVMNVLPVLTSNTLPCEILSAARFEIKDGRTIRDSCFRAPFFSAIPPLRQHVCPYTSGRSSSRTASAP